MWYRMTLETSPLFEKHRFEKELENE